MCPRMCCIWLNAVRKKRIWLQFLLDFDMMQRMSNANPARDLYLWFHLADFWGGIHYDAVRKINNTNYLCGILVLCPKRRGRGILLKWMSSGPGSAKRHDEVVQAHCAEQNNHQPKKPQRGSAPHKGSRCAGGCRRRWGLKLVFCISGRPDFTHQEV